MNAVSSVPSRSRRGALLWLVATQLVVLLSLAPWAVVAGFSFVALDPGAPDPPGVWVARLAVWAYPLLPLACSVLAWRAYRRGSIRRAVTLAALALLAALLLLAYVIWATSPV
ncbi:MAG TPA: hypothetical protein VEW03_09160 [Longimicrobiaceae bacterium]|nr:hypothetical protein [Longimicrobiaceae bacterium]